MLNIVNILYRWRGHCIRYRKRLSVKSRITVPVNTSDTSAKNFAIRRVCHPYPDCAAFPQYHTSVSSAMHKNFTKRCPFWPKLGYRWKSVAVVSVARCVVLFRGYLSIPFCCGRIALAVCVPQCLACFRRKRRSSIPQHPCSNHKEGKL